MPRWRNWQTCLRRQARRVYFSTMYTVYIIKSTLKNWNYVGFTNNLKKRLKQHNTGQVRSTKASRPFEIIFTKNFDNRKDARNFEKYLKVRSNKEKYI